ncbi:MAG: AbrB/MazE/SpoVT family DNA-binding domain-containing protein [Actinomycetota bacterium]|nr:AbrB/MazE/SpoVT family DNA-binding domain-containing protein [Actinomycetota bacterium]
MRTTIDKAGRLVLPKALRDQVGLRPGEVVVTVSGSGLKVESVASDNLVERDGLLLLPDDGTSMTADDVREMRLADQA